MIGSNYKYTPVIPDKEYFKIRIRQFCMMYDKFSCLRIEMTVNDPSEFKIYKNVNHRDGRTSKRWVPMGKSISNLYRYAEIAKAANKHFLNSMCNVIPKGNIEKEINSIRSKKTVKGRCYTGYNVWEPETFCLFEAVSDGSYLIRGFTNHDIRRRVIAGDPDFLKERERMSRMLAKLRAHGLIQKIPHSRRYLVSDYLLTKEKPERLQVKRQPTQTYP